MGIAHGTAIIDSRGPWIVVKTPFNATFIRDLKANIHYENRRWDAEQKVWLVKQEAAANLMEILKQHFDEILEEELEEVIWDREEEEENEILTQPARESALALLYLTKEAPDDVVEVMANFLFKNYPNLKPQVETALLVLLNEEKT